MQLSGSARDALLDAIETACGTAAVLRVLTGSAPANCAAAETGTILAEMTLPSDWMAAASGGVKAKSGTWQDVSANASGTPGYYRIYNSGLTTCHVQGSSGVGSGELNFDGTFTAGQASSVNSFQWTAGNA